MSDLDQQIRDYIDSTSDPIDIDDLFIPPERSIAPVRAKPPSRRFVLLPLSVAAATIGVVIGLMLLGNTGGAGIGPAETADPRAPATTLAEPTVSPTPTSSGLPTTTVHPDIAGSDLSWSVLDLPIRAWTGGVVQNEHGFLAPDEQAIWKSADGQDWDRIRADRFDHGLQIVADEIVDNGSERDATTKSTRDGSVWRDVKVKGDELADSAGVHNYVWKVSDLTALAEVDLPPLAIEAGILLEVGDGHLAIRFETPNGRRRGLDGAFRFSYSENGDDWDEYVPPFVADGFVHARGSMYDAFAMRDGVVMAVLSNGTEYRAWRTTDGQNWDDVTPAEGLHAGGVWSAASAWLIGLDTMLKPGERTFYISADGNEWAPAAVPNEYRFISGEVFVAGDNVFLVRSVNSEPESGTPKATTGPNQDSEEPPDPASPVATSPTEAAAVEIMVLDPSGAAATRTTPTPDLNSFVAGDDGRVPLQLGTVNELPGTDYLDFLYEECEWLGVEGCFRDAHFMTHETMPEGTGPFEAGRPFHVRHGFVNDRPEPLGAGFDVVVYMIPFSPAFSEDGGGAAGQAVRFTSDYVMRSTTDRCGPTYRSQSEPVVCEWFVHDFPDGLPSGRWAMWAEWEAPCHAWEDLGFTNSCADPNEVLSLFSSGVDSPIG